MKTVYSLGYSKRSFQEFIDIIKKHKIEQIIDVRRYPNSRRKNFSKKFLKEKMPELKIKYVHLGNLGGYREKDYSEHMKTVKFKNDFKKLKKLISTDKSAIMCLERSSSNCHRRHIIELLRKHNFKIKEIADKGEIQTSLDFS